MPRDAVSRTANVERNGGQKWVNVDEHRRNNHINLVHSFDQLLHIFTVIKNIFRKLSMKWHPSRLEKQQLSDVQLLERLASLGIISFP